MSSNRIQLTENRFAQLMGEVEGRCPCCGRALLYEKGGLLNKLAEGAHIFPHSPSSTELALLKDCPRLSDDLESLDNLILLCPNCHSQFDHPRTVEEYNKLYSLKKKLLRRSEIRDYYSTHDLESELIEVFLAIKEADTQDATKQLSLSAMTVDAKMNGKSSSLLQQIVTRDVHDYYIAIHEALRELEAYSPGISTLIAQQISTFYLKLQHDGFSQEEIYDAMCEWIRVKTDQQHSRLVPFIVAFYIQNCEVFTLDRSK